MLSQPRTSGRWIAAKQGISSLYSIPSWGPSRSVSHLWEGLPTQRPFTFAAISFFDSFRIFYWTITVIEVPWLRLPDLAVTAAV